MELNASFFAELRLEYDPHILTFKEAVGTSRGVMNTKKCWILTAKYRDLVGTGECSVIPGLSPDYKTDEQYEAVLNNLIKNPQEYLFSPDKLNHFPSILFGLETAILDLMQGGTGILFPSPFTDGKQAIPINGLVWMGDPRFMQEQIETKLQDGFSCIKMKVGAIHFQDEFKLLKSIRDRYSKEQITIRVDANGAFTESDALEKLKQLADLDIHSIEQPIAAGQDDALERLCAVTPLPIALDESLIGVNALAEKQALLRKIKPQYIILKPSLHGGLKGTREWIQIAERLNIPYWITSALESNIGLNVIAQFTATLNPTLPQGLGTGGLFVENFPSSMFIDNGYLYMKSFISH
jgi:o-succinylbenzoate synthase